MTNTSRRTHHPTGSTVNNPHPPDTRLDGPIHQWFSLSYSNYLVLPRTLMQSMPGDWQARAVALLDELNEAFAGYERSPGYIVQPARESEYSDLTDAAMRAVGVTSSADEPDYPKDSPLVYWDADGNEHDPADRVMVPIGEDPIPDYNRGRTYLPPRAHPARDKGR